MNAASESPSQASSTRAAVIAATSNLSTKERLLEAAKELFHQQGIASATIANIAQAAGVPIGNVYYHYRSKDSLLEAVLEAHKSDILGDLEIAKKETTPLKRLKALVRDSERNLQLLTEHSCPYASLAQRLRDEANPLADLAGSLLELYIEFSLEQFKTLNKRDARDLANDFIVRLYGAYTLANSVGDAGFLKRQLKRIETWLETIV